MSQMAEFVIGADATCTDGPCGQVSRVVVDPVAQTVTHLVVEPKHRQGLGRLVPLDLISGTPQQVRLSCSRAQFQELPSAEETQFVPGTAGYAAYGPSQVLSWPYYGLGTMGPAALSDAPFEPIVTNYYQTDPISRASPTMAACTASFAAAPLVAAAE